MVAPMPPPDPASRSLSDTARRAAVVFAIGILALTITGLLWVALDILFVAFAGVLLAVLLRALADPLRKWTGWPLGVSLAVTIVTLLAIISGAVWLGGERIVAQVQDLIDRLPQAVQQLRDQINHTTWGRAVIDRTSKYVQNLPENQTVRQQAWLSMWVAFNGLGYLLLILIVGLYLAGDSKLYRAGLLHLIPLNKRARVGEVLAASGESLRGWMLGQMVNMALVGILTGVGLWLLGVELAITLAILAAVLTFIPNFGPIISAIPAVLLGLTHGPGTGLAVIGLYVGVQTLESYLITPLVQQRQADLPPVLTIIVQIVLGIISGPLGLAIATPLLAATLPIVRMLYVEDTLGDYTVESNGS